MSDATDLLDRIRHFATACTVEDRLRLVAAIVETLPCGHARLELGSWREGEGEAGVAMLLSMGAPSTADLFEYPHQPSKIIVDAEKEIGALRVRAQYSRPPTPEELERTATAKRNEHDLRFTCASVSP